MLLVKATDGLKLGLRRIARETNQCEEDGTELPSTSRIVTASGGKQLSSPQKDNQSRPTTAAGLIIHVTGIQHLPAGPAQSGARGYFSFGLSGRRGSPDIRSSPVAPFPVILGSAGAGTHRTGLGGTRVP